MYYSDDVCNKYEKSNDLNDFSDLNDFTDLNDLNDLKDFSYLNDLIDLNDFSGERRQSDEALQHVSGSDYHGQYGI